MRYASEARLVPHYDSHLEYTSHFNRCDPAQILALLELDVYTSTTALDLGCGNGYLAAWLDTFGLVDVDAVDCSPLRIKSARSFAAAVGARSCRFSIGDVYEYLEESNKRYDVIALFEVLEHLENPEEALRLCFEALEEGGSIVGSVPLRMPYVAHLQVFDNTSEVLSRFAPDIIHDRGGFAFCRWYKR
jgi:2-polyprenyl-3-methyl-5-hydroxy-6-metoxy-1,4-benzoquinol methylase